MATLLDQIIHELRATRPSLDRLAQAGDLLTRHNCPDYESGDAEVDACILTADEDARLREVLRDAIRSESDLERAGQLAWTLSKGTRPEPPDVFRELLRRSLAQLLVASGTMHQCLIALDNGGDLQALPEHQNRKSFAIDNIEQNLAVARAYLAKFGIVVPW